MPFHQAEKLIRIAEIFLVTALLAIGAHFLQERTSHRELPAGDEGSWLSVAAEISRGNGFTTRWLEHPFQTPFVLPRPDDYRYPALVLVLATSFKLFGISYEVALATISAIYLAFCLIFYLLIRRIFGRRTAVTSLALCVFSLLQLLYSSSVYTEGLFGLVLCFVVYTATRIGNRFSIWWIYCGIAIGILYLVRPNGVILVGGLALFVLLRYRSDRRAWTALLASCAAIALVTSPYLIRNWLAFGNPLHIAGSAGLLRTSSTEPLTHSVTGFLRLHGLTYFLKATGYGFFRFFRNLHFFEHGLEIVPLVFAAIAIIKRKRFFSDAIAFGFILTFIACSYASYRSWAGVRYFSPFLPFVYAYGIHTMIRISDRISSRFRYGYSMYARGIVSTLLLALCLAPVVFPHRYYERFFSESPKPPRNFRQHTAKIGRHIGGNGNYYAATLAQLNFLDTFKCVGMQDFFDKHEIIRAQKHFDPTLMVLSSTEYGQSRFAALLDTLAVGGYSAVPVDSSALGVYIRILRE